MDYVSNSTAVSDENRSTPGPLARVASAAGLPANKNSTFVNSFKKAAWSLPFARRMDALEKTAEEIGDKAFSINLESVASMLSLPKNFAKSDRKDIKRKNAIKVMCKSHSFGTWVAFCGASFSQAPLFVNEICTHCTIQFNTGHEERPGTTRGDIRDRDRANFVQGFMKAYAQGEIDVEQYIEALDDLMTVLQLCPAHRTLKALKLTKCPRGSIFKASTTRSALYRDAKMSTNTFGGDMERVVNRFLTFDNKISEKNISDVLSLICCLPVPHNSVIDCIMHAISLIAGPDNKEMLVSYRATWVLRVVLAGNPGFYSTLASGIRNSRSRFVLKVDPRSSLHEHLDLQELDDESWDLLSRNHHKINLADDLSPKVLPEIQFDATNFPTLNAAVEAERAKKERQSVLKEKKKAQQIFDSSRIPKPVSVVATARSSKYKLYGRMPLTVAQCLKSTKVQTKEFVVGKEGKWDTRTLTPEISKVLQFIGRSDLLDPAEKKGRRSKLLKSLVITSSKTDGFPARLEAVNKPDYKPPFELSNAFSALSAFSDLGGGGKVPDKSEKYSNPKHTVVEKVGKGMVARVEKRTFEEPPQWRKHEAKPDGNCFFWCLYYHGLAYERATWKEYFDKHQINYESIDPKEFKDNEWITVTDWVPPIQKYLDIVYAGVKLNVVFYSDLGRILHNIHPHYHRRTINLIYNMDTQNHFDFVFNTHQWTLECESVDANDFFTSKVGVKDHFRFTEKCHMERTYNMVKHELENAFPGCTVEFAVKIANNQITFAYSPNHDRNIKFVTAWNETRKKLENPDNMCLAHVTTESADAKKITANNSGLCLGGIEERARKEDLIRKAIADTGGDDDDGSDEYDGSGSSQPSRDFYDYEDITEELIFDELSDSEVKKLKKIGGHVSTMPTYAGVSAERVYSYSSSILKKLVGTGTDCTDLLCEILSGRTTYTPQFFQTSPHDGKYIVTPALLLLNHLRTCDEPEALNLTIGRIMDFFGPFLNGKTGDEIEELRKVVFAPFKDTVDSLESYVLHKDGVCGFSFSKSELHFEADAVPVSSDDGSSSGSGSSAGPPGGTWTDTSTTTTDWFVWQKSQYSSACVYLTKITETLGSFFGSFPVLGDVFKAVLEIFEEECLDHFRITLPRPVEVAVELRRLLKSIKTGKDTRSLRDMLTKIKRNPVICKMEIRHFDVMSKKDYADLVASYIQSEVDSTKPAPADPLSNQWGTHKTMIKTIIKVLNFGQNPLLIGTLSAFMTFIHMFIYPLLVETCDVKEFSLSALAESLSSPSLRNALRGTKNYTDLHVKLTNASNNHGAILYDLMNDSYSKDLHAGNLFCTAVFLKHLDYYNANLADAICANWIDGFRKFKAGGKGSPQRRLGYGVYCGDLHSNHLIFKEDSIEEIWAKSVEDPHNLRTPVLVELPYSVGYHYPHMDTSPDNLALGCTNRVLRYQVEYPLHLLMFIRKHINYRFENCLVIPIEPGEVLTLEEYLSLTSYTESEKVTIREAWAKFCDELKLEINCNIFVKDESYELFKAPRQIFSTTNMMKAIVGPLVRTMEKRWFSQIDYHVKGLTDKERLEKIQEMDFIPGLNEITSMDFSAMEKHVTPMMHRAQNYFMCQMYANNTHLNKLLEIAMSSCGTRKAYTKGREHIVEITAKMASGDSKTAMNNLMLNEFLQDALDFAYYCYRRVLKDVDLKKRTTVDFAAAKNKWKDLDWFEDWCTIPGKMDGSKSKYLILEGDDSLKIADIGLADFAADFFLELGVDIKILKFDSLETSSFCGIVASSDGILIRDGIKTIIKMGSTNTRYMWSKDAKLAALMKMKAECMLNSYPNCPILSAYCRRIILDYNKEWKNSETPKYNNEILRMLRSEMSSWEWERFIATLERPNPEQSGITPMARAAYEQVFGISPATQEWLEHKLLMGSWDLIKMTFQDFVPLEAKLYTSRYVLEEPLVRGCVAEVFIPEALRYILGYDSHLESYRRFEATNHDRNLEKCEVLW